MVEKPVERIIYKYIDRIKEKEVYVDKIVEVQVTKEVPIYRDKIVEVIKIVEKPVISVMYEEVEKIIKVPIKQEVEKIIYVDRII